MLHPSDEVKMNPPGIVVCDYFISASSSIALMTLCPAPEDASAAPGF